MESNQERWMQLAARAAKEQNPEKLLRLVQELNKVLNEQQPLTGNPPQENWPSEIKAKG
jgi:hypothetical protein